MSNIDMSQIVTAEDKAAAELDTARQIARSDLITLLDEAAATITGPVPLAEQLSWTTKEAAARAHEAGTADSAQAAMLAAEAGQTGETVDVLAAKIVANSEAYRAVSATLAGLRRKYTALIETAETPEAVTAVIDALRADLAQV